MTCNYCLIELKGRNKGYVSKTKLLTKEEAAQKNESFGHPSLRVFEWIPQKGIE